MREKLIGGKGDYRPDSDFDKKALAEGMKVEREHTKNQKKVAREIVKDHLTEDPNYYRKLKKVEKAIGQSMKTSKFQIKPPQQSLRAQHASVKVDPIVKAILFNVQSPYEALKHFSPGDQSILLNQLCEIRKSMAKGGPPLGSFNRIKSKIMAGPGKKPENPNAVTAKVYRAKYGQKIMTQRSLRARKEKEMGKSYAQEILEGAPLNEVLAKANSIGGGELECQVLRDLRKLRKSIAPEGKRGKDPLLKDKNKNKKQFSKQDEGESEELRGPKPGEMEYHRDKAMQHLAAAQAHANAHQSAKKLQETQDHDQKVKDAEEASQSVIQKGGLWIDRSAEDSVLNFFDGGGEIGSDISALSDPRGVQRLAAYRGQIFTKSCPGGGPVGGTIFQGEWTGPRGADNRETMTRFKEQLLTVEDDPVGNQGNGGLEEWFGMNRGKNIGNEALVNVPVGAFKINRENDPEIELIDESDPYTKSLYKMDPRDGAANLRLAHKGNYREVSKR